MSFVCVFANTNNRSIPPQDCSNMVCAAIINRKIFSTIVHQTLCLSSFLFYGAGDQIRTDDNYVGNVVLYQLSYTREGAFDRTRTCDPRFTKPLLYQLSYKSKKAATVPRYINPKQPDNIFTRFSKTTNLSCNSLCDEMMCERCFVSSLAEYGFCPIDHLLMN